MVICALNPHVKISSFLGDYGNAQSAAQAFDSKVQADASAISDDYAGIVALSVRQAFGATELTTSHDGSGFNSSDVLMFMKGLSFLRYTYIKCSCEDICV